VNYDEAFKKTKTAEAKKQKIKKNSQIQNAGKKTLS
jgi:hypothetical protein